MQTVTSARSATAASSSSTFRRHPLMAFAGLLVLGLLIAWGQQLRAAEAAKNKSWSGTWNNKKYNTTGELTCAIIGEQNGQWIARFTGTGLGKPFNYTALITHKTVGTNTTMQGTTRVDGDMYNWTGTISGQNMTGGFRSTTGNNGQFVLKEKK
ncbi:MAG TPA: hypothetical protein VGH19_15485 [Verrucomicrobiae bacterium]